MNLSYYFSYSYMSRLGKVVIDEFFLKIFFNQGLAELLYGGDRLHI